VRKKKKKKRALYGTSFGRENDKGGTPEKITGQRGGRESRNGKKKILGGGRKRHNNEGSFFP